MDPNKVLAENETIGNIIRCQCGVVHINLNGISLHLNGPAFLAFSRMAQEASSKLMDEELKILMDDME